MEKFRMGRCDVRVSKAIYVYLTCMLSYTSFLFRMCHSITAKIGVIYNVYCIHFPPRILVLPYLNKRPHVPI